MRRRDEYMALRCGVGGHQCGGGVEESLHGESAGTAPVALAGVVYHNGEEGTRRSADGSNGGLLVPRPFARLRERTFDMTKRGELTLADVWYAKRQKDRDCIASSVVAEASESTEPLARSLGTADAAAKAANVSEESDEVPPDVPTIER